MKITKLGHCCLLIEEKNLRILTDPGTYSTLQNDVKNIDIILITHEHTDHFHLDSLKIVLCNNPQAKIITNQGVGKLLDIEKIPYQLVEHGQITLCNDVSIEGCGEKHAIMYSTIAPVANTGYYISNTFFYPGDALYNPDKSIKILALPVAGPWMKISEAIDYAKEIKPKICFPVHDGILKTLGTVHRLPNMILPPEGIQFIIPEEGKEMKF